MSLVKKLKDILFEVEEDDTEPIRIQDENKKEEKLSRSVASEPVEIKKDLRNTLDLKPELDLEIKKEVKEEIREEKTTPSERDLFTKENSFKFPEFDEEEFQSSLSRTKQNTNVLDYERKKNSEKKNEYRPYERPARDTEKKKFTPSPIISPVYGILNQDYVADDIVKKEDINIDIDSVRKKAFEVKEEKEMPEALDIVETPNINDIVNDTYKEIHKEVIIDEPVVTFFDERTNNQKEEVKSVNDLLESAADEIDLEETLEIPKVTNNLDVIEEELEKIDDEEKNENKDLDDTLHSDLFELIDSMYDEREEGN